MTTTPKAAGTGSGWSPETAAEQRISPDPVEPAEDVGRRVRRIADGPLPADVDAWARGALLDTLTILVAGTDTGLYRAALATLPAHPGERPVVGDRRRTSAAWAAHLGALAASVLDLDDGHYRGGGIHPGSTVLPVLLAGAPAARLGDLRAALVAGYEVAVRAGLLNSPAHTGESYRASGYAATVGASAALAALRGARAEVISAAVRTAFAHAPHSRMTSAASRESIGWAAVTAVGAVELAEAGFGTEVTDRDHRAPAAPTPFEQAAEHPYVRSLGTEFSCLETYVKPWPCCRAAHAMIEALLRRPSAADVEAIEVHVVPGALGLDTVRPRNLSEAQYALPWLAALTLLRGQDGPTQLPESDLDAPDVLELAARVQLLPGPEPAAEEGYPARVVLRFRDGTSWQQQVRIELGSRERPLPTERLAARQIRLLRTRLDDPAIAVLLRLLDSDRATVEDLLALLAGFPKHSSDL